VNPVRPLAEIMSYARVEGGSDSKINPEYTMPPSDVRFSGRQAIRQPQADTERRRGWLLTAGFLVALFVAIGLLFHGCRKPLDTTNPTPTEDDPVSSPEQKVQEEGQTTPATPAEPVRTLTVSRNGSILAASGPGGRVRLWSIATGKDLPVLENPEADRIQVLSLSPDGQVLACGCGKNILLYSLPDTRHLHTFAAHEQEVRSLAFTPDGRLLLSGGADGFLKLWSVHERKARATLANLYSAVNVLAVTPNGETLVSGSGFLKGDLNLWSLPGGASLRRLPGHERSVTTLAVSDDGTVLASGANGQVRLWSLPEGKPVAQIDNTARVNDLAFLPGAELLACASEDKVIRLWCVPEGKAAKTLTGHRGPIQALGSIPGKSQSLISAGRDGEVLVWDLGTGRSRPPGSPEP
jgi:WD40 repeat protein